ncbi:MAG: TraR/DksA C4-type zinc finger protein [Anaerolineae bacterium]|jgi:DnaK suppressor protein|nr:TraR/DksA family transcriptional regulator [Chloroflexota bacterium]
MSKRDEKIQELEAERLRTLDEIVHLREQLQEEIEPASATDEDSADAAAAIYERGKVISLIQNREDRVRSLEEAIERVRKGLYGICKSCGNEIDPERMAIMPETSLCVRCANLLESGGRAVAPRRRERPIHVLDDEV